MRLWLAVLLAKIWEKEMSLIDRLGIALVGEDVWDDIIDQEMESNYGDIIAALKKHHADNS